MIPNLSRWLLRQPVRKGFNGPLRFLATARTTTTTESITPGVVPGPNKIVLRDYQEECIESVLTAIDEGHKRLGISLATGGGKTIIFTHLIGRIQSASTDADQTLILAHRQELVEQAARHCKDAYPEKTIEVEMGKMHATGYADITIASVPSITSKDRLEKFDPGRFKLVLVDEAHHIVARTYLKTLQHFNLHQKHPGSPTLVGVSATFSRTDGLALGKAIDQIVYHRDFMDMIKDKRLSDLIFTTVQSTADLSRVRTQGKFGDFVTSDLSEAVNTPGVNAITVATWQVKAQPTRKSTLVFCVDVKHILDLCETFRARGIDARYVTGMTKAIDRSQILTAFKNKEFPVLINCGVFTEGTDIPNIDCILLARPTRSRNLLIQIIGRGMRLHPDKENCHVIDMVSTLETGIVTTPTLFGLDPSEIFTEAKITDIQEIQQEAAKEGYVPGGKKKKAQFTAAGGIEITDYNSVIDLLEDATNDKHIRTMSQNSWVGIGADRYYLGGPGGSYLRLEKVTGSIAELAPAFRKASMTHTISNTAAYDLSLLSPAYNDDFDDYDYMDDSELDFGKPSDSPSSVHYVLWYIAAIRPNIAGFRGGSPYAAPRLMLIHTDFSAAVRASDLYASKIFPYAFTSFRAKWRNQPPTPGQLLAVNKMRPKENQLTMDKITKGQASDMITKMKFGAIKTRYAKIEKVKKREQKKADRVKEHHEKLRKDAEVKIGPLNSG